MILTGETDRVVRVLLLQHGYSPRHQIKIVHAEFFLPHGSEALSSLRPVRYRHVSRCCGSLVLKINAFS